MCWPLIKAERIALQNGTFSRRHLWQSQRHMRFAENRAGKTDAGDLHNCPERSAKDGNRPSNMKLW